VLAARSATLITPPRSAYVYGAKKVMMNSMEALVLRNANLYIVETCSELQLMIKENTAQLHHIFNTTINFVMCEPLIIVENTTSANPNSSTKKYTSDWYNTIGVRGINIATYDTMILPAIEHDNYHNNKYVRST
jgi:hypothetical protein